MPLGGIADMAGGGNMESMMMNDLLHHILLNEQSTSGAPPAPESAISSLEKVVVTEDNVEELGECHITQEKFEVGGVAVRLQCKHCFQQESVEKWLRMHNTCPVCREPINPSSESEIGASASSNPAPIPAPPLADFARSSLQSTVDQDRRPVADVGEESLPDLVPLDAEGESGDSNESSNRSFMNSVDSHQEQVTTENDNDVDSNGYAPNDYVYDDYVYDSDDGEDSAEDDDNIHDLSDLEPFYDEHTKRNSGAKLSLNAGTDDSTSDGNLQANMQSAVNYSDDDFCDESDIQKH